jgi:type IX secretion system substrate protein
MKTIKLIVFLLGISFLTFSFYQDDSYNIANAQDNFVLDSKVLDANQIRSWIRNNGSLHYDPITFNAGFEWPKFTNKYAIYASGIWLGAKIHDSLRVAVARYNNEFSPGYVNFNTQTPMGRSDPLYRIYKVSPLYSNGNSDFDPWSVWPINQGAPWVDVNNNGIYEPPADYPVMKGDQNLFCYFTDGYADAHTVDSTLPLNADIQQYVYAKTVSPCTDVMYVEWRIINKKNANWDSLYVCFWSDPDLGNSIDDKAGCDSTLNLGFCYNGTNNDAVYGTAPPALGYLPYEVSRHTGKLLDAFLLYRCDLEYSCPRNALEGFNCMKGRKRDGTIWINPVTNQPTTYLFSGDPESMSGWLENQAGERSLTLSSYIGTVVPLDTVVFKTAIFIKRGTNNLNSVSVIKSCVNQIIGIEGILGTAPNEFRLYQNYPNPFNPKTNITYHISKSSFVILKVVDMLGKETAVLVNQQLKPGIYEIDFDGTNLSTGLYFYQLIADGDVIDTKKMVLIK